jgi:hypothetical protein
VQLLTQTISFFQKIRKSPVHPGFGILDVLDVLIQSPAALGQGSPLLGAPQDEGRSGQFEEIHWQSS